MSNDFAGLTSLSKEEFEQLVRGKTPASAQLGFLWKNLIGFRNQYGRTLDDQQRSHSSGMTKRPTAPMHSKKID